MQHGPGTRVAKSSDPLAPSSWQPSILSRRHLMSITTPERPACHPTGPILDFWASSRPKIGIQPPPLRIWQGWRLKAIPRTAAIAISRQKRPDMESSNGPSSGSEETTRLVISQGVAQVWTAFVCLSTKRQIGLWAGQSRLRYQGLCGSRTYAGVDRHRDSHQGSE